MITMSTVCLNWHYLSLENIHSQKKSIDVKHNPEKSMSYQTTCLDMNNELKCLCWKNSAPFEHITQLIVKIDINNTKLFLGSNE